MTCHPEQEKADLPANSFQNKYMQRSLKHPEPQLLTGFILYMACLLASPILSQENKPVKTLTQLHGTVQYQTDTEKPWRFARYYVHGVEKFLAESIIELVPVGDKNLFPNQSERISKTHLMDQENFMFIPETLAIQLGDKVRFKNSEEAFHNVMCLNDKPPYNVNLAKNQEHIHQPKVAKGAQDPLNIRCVFHGAMKGWIFVFKHQYFKQTDKSGTFHFTNFPEGTYKLRIAHPSGGLYLETEERKLTQSIITPWNIILTPEHLKAQSE